MKTSKNYSKFLCTLITILMCLSLIACGNKAKPDETVKNFFDSIKKQDAKNATTYLNETSLKLSFDNERQEKIANLVFSKIKYNIIETAIDKDKDSATVKTKIVSVDLMKINENLTKELLPKILELAFTGNTDKEKPKKMMDEYYNKSISNKSAPTTESEVYIKLNKKDGKWIIENDSKLTSAITGNLDASFDKLNNQNVQITVK